MLAVFKAKADIVHVEIMGGRNINHIDIGAAEHFFIGTVSLGNAVGLGECLGPLFGTAGHRHHFRSLHQFHALAEMGGDRTGADDTETTN